MLADGLDKVRNVANAYRHAQVTRITLDIVGVKTADGRYGVALDDPFRKTGENTGVILWFDSEQDYLSGIQNGNRLADQICSVEVYASREAAATALLELASN